MLKGHHEKEATDWKCKQEEEMETEQQMKERSQELRKWRRSEKH